MCAVHLRVCVCVSCVCRPGRAYARCARVLNFCLCVSIGFHQYLTQNIITYTAGAAGATTSAPRHAGCRTPAGHTWRLVAQAAKACGLPGWRTSRSSTMKNGADGVHRAHPAKQRASSSSAADESRATRGGMRWATVGMHAGLATVAVSVLTCEGMLWAPSASAPAVPRAHLARLRVSVSFRPEAAPPCRAATNDATRTPSVVGSPMCTEWDLRARAARLKPARPRREPEHTFCPLNRRI